LISLMSVVPALIFFMADILDAALKDEMTSMQFPLFALKPGDKEIREYTSKKTSLKVIPTAAGAASIFDKDIWIYCISQVM